MSNRPKQLPAKLRGRPIEVALFLFEFDELCRKHGMSLAHEDDQGAFLVHNYARKYRNRLWTAHTKIKLKVQPRQLKIGLTLNSPELSEGNWELKAAAKSTGSELPTLKVPTIPLAQVIQVTNDLDYKPQGLVVPYYIGCEDKDLPSWHKVLVSVWHRAYRNLSKQPFAHVMGMKNGLITSEDLKEADLLNSPEALASVSATPSTRDYARNCGLSPLQVFSASVLLRSACLWENGVQVQAISAHEGLDKAVRSVATVIALTSRGVQFD